MTTQEPRMPDVELLPCPWCGQTKMEVAGWTPRVFVRCQTCKSEGPAGYARNDAIAAWNRREEPQSNECDAPTPFAWATFDGEGSWDLRLYAGNEGYRNEYIARNGEKYAGWVRPLYEQAEPQSVVPNGWKLVPIEATEAMLDAATPSERVALGALAAPFRKGLTINYRKMVAAAPSPTTEG